MDVYLPLLTIVKHWIVEFPWQWSTIFVALGYGYATQLLIARYRCSSESWHWDDAKTAMHFKCIAPQQKQQKSQVLYSEHCILYINIYIYIDTHNTNIYKIDIVAHISLFGGCWISCALHLNLLNPDSEPRTFAHLSGTNQGIFDASADIFGKLEMECWRGINKAKHTSNVILPKSQSKCQVSTPCQCKKTHRFGLPDFHGQNQWNRPISKILRQKYRWKRIGFGKSRKSMHIAKNYIILWASSWQSLGFNDQPYKSIALQQIDVL